MSHNPSALYMNASGKFEMYPVDQLQALYRTRNPIQRTHRAGALIMRLQPLTLLHEELISGALAACDQVLLVIGSAFESTSLKNPFTYELRKAWVTDRFKTEVASGRLRIEGIEDYHYRPAKWYKEFYNLVDSKLGKDWVLYTFAKDASTKEYIDGFRKDLVRVYHNSSDPTVNATDVRMAFFRGTPTMNIPHISMEVAMSLHLYKLTPDYKVFCKELEAIDAYRELWKELKDENGKVIRNPFPVQFNAVDNLCVWKDRWKKPYILVIRRNSDFGNGKLAIPGGYVEADLTVRQNATKELKEETGLEVAGADQPYTVELQDIEVFDEPGRSMRGRMITFCHVWNVYSDKMPTVVGGSDASEAFWLPIDEIYANKRNFFSDHYHIISRILPDVDTFR